MGESSVVEKNESSLQQQLNDSIKQRRDRLCLIQQTMQENQNICISEVCLVYSVETSDNATMVG